jgi:syntaxin 5
VSQAQLQPDAEAAYLDARAADVQALERHIADLGGMFARLATLVSEQGESVQRIEDSVSATLVNIDASAGVLQRAWERARDNGALAVRVSAILIFFVLLFVLFGT